MVQWTDGAQKILYNQRGFDSYKLTKKDQQEADMMTGWMPWERQEEAIARHDNHGQHKLSSKEKLADAKTS